MGFALFIIAVVGTLLLRAIGVVIASGPKGWITLSVVAALVGVALIQERLRTRRE